ncbi:MAG: YraN family protein [Steroidobacteraceae bacterium]
MEPTYRKEAGERGEQLALSYLQAAGLKLLKRNFRCAGGEIDLVMTDGRILMLVEVRFRSSRSFGGAAASVDAGKQQRLTRAAQYLLQRHPAYQLLQARFDLVAIDGSGNTPHIEWIKDAFRVGA